MLGSSGIIKSAMTQRGYKHRRTEDQFTIRGEYARNLQYVYSKEYQTKDGLVVDLVYFSADITSEKLVIGLYRENPTIENGVYVNSSRSMALQNFNTENLSRELDKLLISVKGRL